MKLFEGPSEGGAVGEDGTWLVAEVVVLAALIDGGGGPSPVGLCVTPRTMSKNWMSELCALEPPPY